MPWLCPCRQPCSGVQLDDSAEVSVCVFWQGRTKRLVWCAGGNVISAAMRRTACCTLLFAVLACLTAGLNAEVAHVYINNLSSKSIVVTITYSNPAATEKFIDREIAPHNNREYHRSVRADKRWSCSAASIADVSALVAVGCMTYSTSGLVRSCFRSQQR